jgi:hypothetical protein
MEIHFPMKKTTLLVALLATAGLAKAQCNLVTNGDFSSGASGFTSGYTQSCDASVNPSPLGSLDLAGAYCVSTNMQDHHIYFANCTYQGNMFVANGGTNASTVVWSETVSVTPNTTYTFRLDAASAVGASPAHLVLSVNGSPSSATTLSSNSCDWQTLTYSWTSGASTTSATLEIFDANTAAGGNDFALDNVSFSTAPIISVPGTTVTNSVCNGATGSITVSASGSSAPYEYSLNGGPYQTSNMFTGLAAGPYVLTVRNACGDVSAPATVTVGTIITPVTVAVTSSTDASGCVCPAVTTGTITISAIGTAPFSYSVNGGSWTSFSGNTYTITGLAPLATYSVRVKDACGNISSAVATYISKKVKVMHYTGSSKNPSNVICIDIAAVPAHVANHSNVNSPYQHDYVIDPCSAARITYNNASAEEIRISPNPNNGIFQVMVPQMEADAQMLISDVQGRIVHKEVITTGTTAVDVNLSKLGKGIYFINVDADGHALKSKLVIE